MANIQDSETADYGIFSGRTASEYVVLEVYRQAQIPVRFDRSNMVALVNGRPVARVAYEKGAHLYGTKCEITAGRPSGPLHRGLSKTAGTSGMEKRDHEHGIKKRPPQGVREYAVLQKCRET